ncbi:hypothetical protein [Acinetobacter sp. ANC 4193]
MEESGWLQGHIVKHEDVANLLELAGKSDLLDNDNNVLLIVASGSCDVANKGDLIIEFSVARYIEHDGNFGNYCFNKNPRRLNCTLESIASGNLYISLQAYEKISVIKDKIPEGISPNLEIQFTKSELGFYVDWLASRYKRPAFPTEFDRRIDAAWKKEKRRKAAIKVSDKLIGIYAKVYPDKEIIETDNYSVDLLALVTDLDSDQTEVEKLVDQYKKALQDAKMDVGEVKITTEFKVSVGTLKQYKRFNLDELSYKSDDPLPPEINMQ